LIAISPAGTREVYAAMALKVSGVWLPKDRRGLARL